MNKDQKVELVNLLKDKLTNSEFVAVIHYRGMSDSELYNMRVQLKEKDCNIKIAKNTLVKIAIKDSDLEAITPHLEGPTAILYSNDIVALSKVLSDFANKVKALEIKTGFFNKELMDVATIKQMAKLGSLDEVRASFIGVLNGAQSNFVRILNAPSEGLASLKKE